MGKHAFARIVVLAMGLLCLCAGGYAQSVHGKVTVTAVSDSPGWYDVQFHGGDSPYSLKNLTVERVGKEALIDRLYVDEVAHKARIELVNKGLNADVVDARIETSLHVALQPAGK